MPAASRPRTDPATPAAGVAARAPLWRALRRLLQARTLILLAYLGLFASLLLLWRYTPLSQLLDLDVLTGWGRRIQALPAAPLIVLGCCVLAVALAMPVAVIISASAVVFGPWAGMGYAFFGLLAGALATYGIGRATGARLVDRFGGAKVDALTARLRQRGLPTMIFVRVVPVAPFLLVNVAAGALRVRLADYLVGTIVGILPGVVFITWFTDSLTAALQNPGPASFALLAACLVLGVAMLVGIRRYVVRRRAQQARAA